MEKTIPPIPAFYACYLLRSIARHSSTYIGSTPNPPRRLRQHNGESKGGAVRTARESLRPWEMTCLVTGFPSKIAALQFEWAWQNPNLTRHIEASTRITQSKTTTRISPRTGKTRKRAARPRQSLSDRLANVRLLLKTNSFKRWPLKLTFYSEDVYRVWQKLSSQSLGDLRPGIKVELDQSCLSTSRSTNEDGDRPPTDPVGIHAIDVGYSTLKPQLQRSQAAFDSTKAPQCAVCHHDVPRNGAATLVCTSGPCSTTSHVQCLSSTFLRAEGARPDVIVPTSGCCPKCGVSQLWPDLVKDLSMRMRGEKEIKALYKQKRGKKGAKAAAPLDGEESSTDEDDPLDMVLGDEEEGWYDLCDSSDEGEVSKQRSGPSPARKSVALKAPETPHPELVIQDSDWDEAELLT